MSVRPEELWGPEITAKYRREFRDIKGYSLVQFVDEMNKMHSRAYFLAEKHYAEAMDIVLTPKQMQAVLVKAREIREEWDGIDSIDLEATKDVSG